MFKPGVSELGVSELGISELGIYVLLKLVDASARRCFCCRFCNYASFRDPANFVFIHLDEKAIVDKLWHLVVQRLFLQR